MSEYIYNTAAKEATAFTKQRNAAFAREFQIDLEDAYNSEVALPRRGCLKKLDGFRLKDIRFTPVCGSTARRISRQVFLRCCRERSTRCVALMWRI